MANNEQGVVSVKFPIELIEILNASAANEGMTVSELLRIIVRNWAHGGMPTVDDGYREAVKQARRIAAGFVIGIAKRVAVSIAEELPTTPEEAYAMLGGDGE